MSKDLKRRSLLIFGLQGCYWGELSQPFFCDMVVGNCPGLKTHKVFGDRGGAMKFDVKEFLKKVKDYEFERTFDMNELAKNFFQGLLLLVPVVVTISVVFFVFTAIDGWLNIPVPGLGFLFTIGIIILVGRLTTNVFVQGALQSLDNILGKTPFVKLLYTSIKDLIEAFMGEQKRFDQPVIVNLVASGHAKAIGFVTRKSLSFLGLEDHVAVYFPQSYNFAGNLLVFPGTQVQPLSLDSSEVMAFIVSGGISGGNEASVSISPSV